ncbi:ABC transporter ATP-binding protein [Streptomyces coeruleorubidus]|uniref:ABC transporter ATP-binding protein n=1 Tax=Streptomyces coeruleorubidus TaxID=116188 RepID=UPI00368CF4BD
MTTTAPVVAFDQVSKAYAAVRAVDGLTLALRPGETVALLGPNGAGKSTTLDLLLGLKEPDSGTVRHFGTSPRDAIVAGRVGAMLQSGGLMDEVTVAELVRLACDLHPKPYRPSEVLSRAGIEQIADRKADKLSGGQAQRVRFALATAGDSDLIVLDEPTTGMDVTTRQAFWATMREQADRGRTVLFATHYLEEADAVADRVLVLHRGRLLADGTAAEIKERARPPSPGRCARRSPTSYGTAAPAAAPWSSCTARPSTARSSNSPSRTTARARATATATASRASTSASPRRAAPWRRGRSDRASAWSPACPRPARRT